MRLPFFAKVKAPYESVSGFSLLATHTIIRGKFLYHIPRYRFLESPGEKKPNSNLWPEETKVSPLMMDCIEAMISAPEESSKSRERKKMNENLCIGV
jgi:hypothetical protein